MTRFETAVNADVSRDQLTIHPWLADWLRGRGPKGRRGGPGALKVSGSQSSSEFDFDFLRSVPRAGAEAGARLGQPVAVYPVFFREDSPQALLDWGTPMRASFRLAERTPSSQKSQSQQPSAPADIQMSASVTSPATGTNGQYAEPQTSQLMVAHSPVAGKSNGALNGRSSSSAYHESRDETRTMRTTSKTKSESRTNISKEQRITVLHETVISTRGKFIAEIDHVNEHYIDSMSFQSFLDYIERERLTHMPHRGSRWDKVLKWAEFFALQISGYAKAVESFISDSKDAAKLICAAARVLLELGPDNAPALETTFGVFHKLGLSLSFFIRHNDLLHVNGHIRMEVGNAFNALLMLVRDVAIYYQAKISDISSNNVSIDFNSVFGKHLEAFYRRKNHITDAMWEYMIGDNVSVDIRTLRKWLVPCDRTARTILDDGLAAKGHRDEFSCEWFQRPLLDFSRGEDDLMSVSGTAGCGKSFLSGWILERLQRPLGRKTYTTISYSVEADIPTSTTSLAIVKNLVLQLLESDVGDTALFKALEEAYEISMESKDTSKLEESLWKAVDIGFANVKAESSSLMVVIDGLDEVKGGEHHAKTIFHHLENLSSKHEGIKIITFSRSHIPSTKKTKIYRLEITPDHTHNDIRHLADALLCKYAHFKDQNEHEREGIVEQIIHAAKGNFLWMVLTVELLKQETSHDGFMKAIKAMKEGPRTLNDTVQKITNALDFSKSTTSVLFSLLLVTERPLTVKEVKCLLEVDPQTGAVAERRHAITDEIKNACGSLVFVQNGVVRFRHAIIRAHLLQMQNEKKRLKDYETAQTDFVARILAYCKSILTRSYEPAFEHIDASDVDDLFHKHALLEYAVRYWILHFQGCSIYKSSGSLEFPAEFKAVFPSSTQLALLEWSCWEPQSSALEAISMHDLAVRVRQGVLTENHESVVQTLIICGNLHKKVSNMTEAGTCFYRASRIGQTIFRKYSSITMTCATTFLTVTESITVTKRTEVVNRKEEILKYVIVAYEHQHGKSSDIVIRHYKMLAQMYVEIHEEHQAEIIWRKLQEIVIGRHGKGSEEAKDISGKLTIVLKKGEKQEDVIEYEKEIFQTSVNLEVWDVRRIQITLELASSYETRGELSMAEELYVMLWGRLTEHCHHHHHTLGVDIHISMIDIALEYVRFLRRHHRHEEAANILICIWTEYEEYDFESETLFLRLKVIGELMRAVSLLSVAVSVFKKCWGWFQSHGKGEHVASCEILISETTQEIVKTTTSTTTTSTTATTTTTETVIKEVFESTMSQSTVTTETITISKSLLSYYMKLEQWSAAIEVTKRSLSMIWKMIVSGGGTCALPKDFGSDAIDIAMSLAICYRRSHRFHEAEEIYVRIYRACRNSCSLHDERLTKAYTVLIQFYEEHHHWSRMISIYQEMLIEYRRHFDASHALTIKTLYLLGSLCSEHGHGSRYEYYEEIITVVNKDSEVCHRDAVEAMTILCRMYYEDGHWHKLHHVCRILWKTWIHHHEHKFDAEFIELLYMRYRYVLEHHIHCEYEVLRIITIEYRDTCVKVFGASVTTTIMAMIELAEMNMRSEKYIHEAISTYEEVLTKTTTTTTTTTTVISTTTITTVKERLSKAYVVVCGHKSTSTTTVERAIKILLERFEYLKITIGYAKKETLVALRELVVLYMKLKTEESHKTAVRILTSTTIDIITKEKHSISLYDAAKTVGEMYLSFGLVEEGLELLRELRRQLITGISSSKKFSFKLDKSVGRIAFVYLVTFEETIRGSVNVSFSQVMADLLVEITLYESYKRCTTMKTTTEVVLTHGARLRAFLVSHKRNDQIKPLEDELFENFLKKWGTSIKTQREVTREFFVAVLVELGGDRRDVHIGDAACISGNNAVRALIEQGNYHRAYEVAQSAFQFIKHVRAYHQLHNVGYGFKLSGYLAQRGVKMPQKPIEPETRAQMLELSKSVIRDVLQACKESNINFVRLQISELNGLVGLLGAQQNFHDLEWLLKALWTSREIHHKWTPETIVAIGKRLVQAYFLGGHGSVAIPLCEDICYNLRRVWGSLHPKTLEMSKLLSQVYLAAGHSREAMGVHEEILQLVVEGDDDDDRTIDTVEPRVAREHIDLLKHCHQQLGGWDKGAALYQRLVSQLMVMPEFKNSEAFKGLTTPDKWNAKEKSTEGMGQFIAPKDWQFVDPSRLDEKGELVKKVTATPLSQRPGFGQRVSSNWNSGFIHQFFYGEDEE